ncbi:MAG: fatty-acid--CoA ligase [Aldersonia sp.]|nr:fatty-acid--CoA ligase [Aldersonia sp.]
MANITKLWDMLNTNEAGLERIGIRHLVVYQALRDPNRVFVTLGIRARRPLEVLLRSSALFTWFDAVGVEEIPPLFAGHAMEKIELAEAAGTKIPARIVVAALAPVRDLDSLLVNVHDRQDRLRRAGIRKVWIYRALDDDNEAMVLQELDSPEHASRWIDHPDSVAEWMSGVGRGVYPPVFVGTVRHVLSFGKPN